MELLNAGDMPTRRNASERLGKSDWVEAGLATLAERGVEAVRVEPLAGRLGVTKGSFYWHFANRDALLAEMLVAWQRVATHAIIDEVEAAPGDALAKLKSLFAIVARLEGRLELAVRRWAAVDAGAREALVGIDKRRLDYLEALFRELGFDRGQARARGRLVYNALIGQFTRGVAAPSAERSREALAIVLPMLTRRD
jgi:AcrR family transcriptional regulator